MTPGQDFWHTFWRWLGRTVAANLPAPRPHKISITLLREEPMALFYAVHLPPGPADLSKRTLSISVNGNAAILQPAVEGGELSFTRGDGVAISLIDTSADGIDSLPSEALIFTAVNPTPPPTPGAVTVEFLREADV